ncbi:MAG: glycosyltransferase [Candidatus Cryptobacteroides sp.]
MIFSIIIPVYNRSEELKELLDSIRKHAFRNFELIVVDDGSNEPCKALCEQYKDLIITYLYKENGGPASARNAGARMAKGEYLLFLDSDTLIPDSYFEAILGYLEKDKVDLFGGPDMSDPTFSPLQKAISYSMTSFFTTGGIRGGKKKLSRFIPRSFNMGVSREAFEAVNGFAPMRFGEDMDFSMRLMERGYRSALISQAAIYHKRRTSLRAFYRQVLNSGRARIELSIRHKGSLKLVHLLPLAFFLGSIGLIVLSMVLKNFIPAALLLLYCLLILLDSSIKEKSLQVGLLSIASSFVQLYAYALGFLDNFFKRCILRRNEIQKIDNERFYS